MKIFLKDMATLVERSWILSNNLGDLLSFSLLLCTRTDPCSLEKNNGFLLHFDLYIVFLLFWARLPVLLGLNKVLVEIQSRMFIFLLCEGSRWSPWCRASRTRWSCCWRSPPCTPFSPDRSEPSIIFKIYFLYEYFDFLYSDYPVTVTVIHFKHQRGKTRKPSVTQTEQIRKKHRNVFLVLTIQVGTLNSAIFSLSLWLSGWSLSFSDRSLT